MTRVFDASAVLAALGKEPGGEQVETLWFDGGINLISTVNLAEVVSKLVDRGLPTIDVRTVMDSLPLRTVDLDVATAHAAGELRASTKALGLSLGDRVCLALGRIRNATVVTADKAWALLDDHQVVLVR